MSSTLLLGMKTFFQFIVAHKDSLVRLGNLIIKIMDLVSEVALVLKALKKQQKAE